MTRRAGYSVFEVLIAFAIMALVLSALLPAQARLLARASREDETMLAYDFALSRLAVLSVVRPIELGQRTFVQGPWQAQQSIVATRTTDTHTIYEMTVVVLSGNSDELARAAALRRFSNE